MKRKVAGVERFELPTPGFGIRCSTNWSYTPAMDEHYTQAKMKVKAKLSSIACLLVY